MLLRLIASVLVIVAATCVQLGAGEAPTAGEASTKAAANSPTATTSPVADDRSLLASETKQYVARLTEQRNLLRQENDTLRSREGLLLIYGAALTLLSGWLMIRTLRRPAPRKADENDTSPFPASGGTTATVRKNATITIRNSNTQQAEVVDKIQTRRAYARSESSSHVRPATRPIERHETQSIAAQAPTRTVARQPQSPQVVAPELDPATPTAPIPTRRLSAQSLTTKAPATVRIEHQSDRLAPVEVAVKPGTTPVRRVTADT